uniref:ATP synthase subunit a n=1 Tax=Asphondylia rosetta TaxID=420168 RepID=C7FIM1_9DIPT|nr:ATP synthase F0 subunit 6 [Asphondylia rosetta]
MMNNIFSMFDPSTNLFIIPMNWIIMLLIILFLPNNFWLINNNFTLIFKKIFSLMYNEFKIILNNKINNFNLFFISLFMMISLYNFMGLFPYIFTSTSHLSINFSLAIPLWLTLMIYGWINKTNHMFTHLVPQNTPNLLIMFMVLIELISLFMRPITLMIRLTANLIAGHLLLTLLSSMGSKLSFILMNNLLLIQIILLILESAVSIIQAYVFSILITLYTSEI